MSEKTKNEVVEWELSNNCSCENFDEETGISSPSNECWGCYDDEMSNIWYEVIKPWLDVKGYTEDTTIQIDGIGMGWQSRSGYAFAKPRDICDKLGINGDFTLYFTFDGTEMTAKRTSHDEPTGAGFTFTEATELDLDDLDD
jgi:hypothetical protein